MENIGPGLQVPYEVHDLADFGKGLFATEKIAQGTLIWRFEVGKNVVAYDEAAATKHLETLSMPEAKDFLDLTYGIQGLWFVKMDDIISNDVKLS